MRQQAGTAQLAAVLARSQGADTAIPDPQQIVADFHAALAAPPEPVADADRYVLMQALGLR